MVRIVIATHVTRTRGGQPFTVYPVDVFNNGKNHQVERRYRDFYELHSELKRTTSSSTNLPDFPPKKIRNLSSRVIEERRLRLQLYLQSLVSHPPLPSPLVSFLELEGDGDSLPLGDVAEDLKQLDHRPVIGFSSDTGLVSLSQSSRDSSLPDIVIKGALHALYS